MFARVPASSANLGPGFDTLAVALELFVEVSVEPAPSFSISSEGFGAGQFDHPEHLAAQIVRQVVGHSNFRVHINSQIPLSRGLGSSAALAVAAAAAADAPDPLAIGTQIDGHAENAAASLIGGLITASVHPRDGIVARPLALDEAWRFVVVVPDQELATADARRVLPASVPFGDAVHNLNSMGLLIAGLADHRDFVPSAMEDHLHQPYRMGLLPYAEALLERLKEAGAAGSCWSGAGSSMLGLVLDEFALDARSAATRFLEDHHVAGTVLVLDADRVGLVTS